MTKRKSDKSNGGNALQPVRELTERERARRDELRERNLERPDRPESAFEMDGATRIVRPANDGDINLYSVSMLEAFGTRSIPFLNDTLDNITKVMSSSQNITERQHDAAVAIMAAVEPQDELEATLAAQMVAANDCAMRCMRSMAGSQMTDHHQMYGNLANKFMRTFAAQMEALAKHRRGGEQVVKYIHVHEGGQAVVAGTINQGGRRNGKDDGQAQGTGPASQCSALSGPDPARDGMPLPSDVERPLSHSRRQEHRSTKGE